MYQISEVARLVGLSRTTLLYYEKLGLLKSKRQNNGYRLYSNTDVQQLRLLQQLQAGGLTLEECRLCLQAKVDKHLLQSRLQQLEHDIAAKQQARGLLLALLGQKPLRSFHQLVDKVAPEAHLTWLQQQGFDEKQALHLKWLSKDMNEHDRYMADFMAVFQGLERWGPGSEQDTLRALAMVAQKPAKVLDIGCGKGFATITLAQHTAAQITAIDNEPDALAQLEERLQSLGLTPRVSTLCASMTAIPSDTQHVDLIWAEASAYIMGVPQALKCWQPLLTAAGCLVISDLVWLTDTPAQECSEFWAQEYPDMQTVDKRLAQMKAAGYQVLSHFTLSDTAWHNYYQPLKQRVEQLAPTMSGSAAIADLRREIDIYQQYLGQFGYQMFILQR